MSQGSPVRSTYHLFCVLRYLPTRDTIEGWCLYQRRADGGTQPAHGNQVLAGKAPTVVHREGERIGRQRLLCLDRQRIQRDHQRVRRLRDRAQVGLPHCYPSSSARALLTRSLVVCSEIYSVPKDLREILENCLGEDPSPQVLNTFMPEVRRVLFHLYQGLQAKQPFWQRAVMENGNGQGTPPSYMDSRS
jgi:hypothetical protein